MKNVLDFSYHQNYHKLICIPQYINFVRKSKEGNGAKMFFIVGKPEKTILNFSKHSLFVTE